MAALYCASGRGAGVLIGTAAYNFKTWSYSQEEKLNDQSNFSGAGFRTFCRGLDTATIQLEGAYDIAAGGAGGAMAFTLGTSYSVTLQVTSTLTYVVTALCQKADLSQDVDGMAMLKVSLQVNGSFGAAIT